MKAREAQRTSKRLSNARRGFERWRKTKEPRARIPEELWKAAVAAALEIGAWPACQELRLNHTELKRRVEATKAKKERGKKVGFVEIPMCAVSGGAECAVEMEDRKGVRLRLEMKGASMEEVKALARELWKGRR